VRIPQVPFPIVPTGGDDGGDAETAAAAAADDAVRIIEIGVGPHIEPQMLATTESPYTEPCLVLGAEGSLDVQHILAHTAITASNTLIISPIMFFCSCRYQIIILYIDIRIHHLNGREDIERSTYAWEPNTAV